MTVKINIDDIKFYGGRLCLDYINTVHDRFAEVKNDYLSNINDFIEWTFRSDVINSTNKKLLEKVVKKKPTEAQDFFIKAITLRELLYRLFLSIIQGKKIFQNDLDLFNKLLSDYFSKLELKQVEIHLYEGWSVPSDSLYSITAPIVKDAYELLLTGKQGRIKECPNCGWLFYDSSKNGRRRWCSMDTCGSRIKALEWYKRHKQK